MLTKDFKNILLFDIIYLNKIYVEIFYLNYLYRVYDIINLRQDKNIIYIKYGKWGEITRNKIRKSGCYSFYCLIKKR